MRSAVIARPGMLSISGGDYGWLGGGGKTIIQPNRNFDARVCIAHIRRYRADMSRYDRQLERKRFLKTAGIILFFVLIVVGFLWSAQQNAAPIDNPGASVTRP